MPRQAARTKRNATATAGGRQRAPRKRDQEVLEAAAKVFHRVGYSEASIQEVANELGILKGSLYHYIDSKEDLLFRLVDQTHDEVHQVLEGVAAVEGLGPAARIGEYVRRQVEYNFANLVTVTVYFREVDRLSSKRGASIMARRREHEQWLTGLIVEAQGCGEADPKLDAHVLSRNIFASIIWTYRWYRPERDDGARVAETCAAFAVHGIGGRAKKR